jgi:Dictyostelium (slime mold) repeat
VQWAKPPKNGKPSPNDFAAYCSLSHRINPNGHRSESGKIRCALVPIGAPLMRVVAVMLTMAILSSCQCKNPLTPVEIAGPRIAPARLDFEPTWLTATRTQTIGVENPNRVTMTISIAVDAPFSAAETLELGPGETAQLGVRFRPVNPGAMQGELRLTHLTSTTRIPLTGEGVAWPTCQPSQPCHTLAFDALQGRCVDTVSADGSTCSTPCLATAQCQQGICVGSTPTCDDADACTVDACGATGCLHTPVTCAVPGRCEVARCDAALGCVKEPISDGTPCGNSRCEAAFICLNGQCEERQKPNAALECRYETVIARNGETCARTLGGQVVCWGQNRSTRYELPRFTNTQGLYTRALCAFNGDAGVRCELNDFEFSTRPKSIFPYAPSFSAPMLCGVLSNGAVECVANVATVPAVTRTLADAGVLEAQTINQDVCLLWDDGGLSCAASLGYSGPFAHVPESSDVMCAIDTAGVAHCSLFASDSTYKMSSDAGLTMTSAAYYPGGFLEGGTGACAVDRLGRVSCISNAALFSANVSSDGGPLVLAGDDVLTPPVRALSTSSVHACAIDAAGSLWCRGKNDSLQLGDRSPQPAGIFELPVSDVHAVTFSSRLIAGFSDAGHRGWGTFAAFRDAGSVHTTSDGPSAWAKLSTARVTSPVQALTGNVLALDPDGGLWAISEFSAYSSWRRIVQPPGAASELAGSRVIVSGTAYELIDGAPWSLGPAIGISDSCTLRADAGAECKTGRFETSYPLPWAVRSLSKEAGLFGGCALTTSGQVGCWKWNSVTSAAEYAIINGVRAFPRLVAGTREAGCAASHLNGLQCWGDNRAGILARGKRWGTH